MLINCFPGRLFIYKEFSWKPVSDENTVDYQNTTYVIIHGAHSSVNNYGASRLARLLKTREPDANVIGLDWSYWANINPVEVKQIVNEAVRDWLLNGGETNDENEDDDNDQGKNKKSKNGKKSSSESIFNLLSVPQKVLLDEDDFNNKFLKLQMDILCRIIPVEQTKNIPLLAENLTWTLFGKKGEQKTFTIRETETDKQKTDTWKSLGLDPAKTCLIGHSHGAHIAGLTGMYSIRDSYGTIKRIIALDPSNQNCHQFDGNKNGKGWNRDAADYLDVYRTTWLFSANILYGDLNLHIINKNHPHVCMKKPEQSDVIMNAPYIVSYLTGYFLTEYNDHVGVYEYFVKMMVKDRTLHQLDYKTDKPNNKWIIRYKMKEKSKMKNPKLKW